MGIWLEIPGQIRANFGKIIVSLIAQVIAAVLHRRVGVPGWAWKGHISRVSVSAPRRRCSLSEYAPCTCSSQCNMSGSGSASLASLAAAYDLRDSSSHLCAMTHRSVAPHDTHLLHTLCAGRCTRAVAVAKVSLNGFRGTRLDRVRRLRINRAGG